MVKELLIEEKTIFNKFPDFEDFFNEIRKVAENLNLINDREEESLFFTFNYCVYDKQKFRIYFGSPEEFYGKLFSGIISRFITLQKRERLWSNIFEHLKLEMSRLIDIKTTEYIKQDGTKYSDTNRSLSGDYSRTSNLLEKGEHREAQRITNSEKPYSTIDLLGQEFGNIQDRADWLSTEAKIDTGYIGIEKDKDGKPILGEDGQPIKIINPNFNRRSSKNLDTSSKNDTEKQDNKQTDYGIIDKVIYSQEQPIFYQQLARIMPSFTLVQSDWEELTDFSEYFHFTPLIEGEFRWNSNDFTYDYIPREQLLVEAGKPEEKTKKEFTKDPDQDLSEDEWKELWAEKVKPCMPTWYLEQIYRYKKRIEKKPSPDETDQARLEICEVLLDAFYRAPYVPPISVFEAVMGSPNYDWAKYEVDAENLSEARKFKKDNNIQIGDILSAEVIGFKDFKSQMWESLKLFHLERSLGEKPTQVFPILIGPPGTGKSEITRWLSIAFRRPIQIINVGGMDDGGELEGKRATLQSASYGKVLEGFLERSILAEITIEDLKLEIEEIKTYVDENGNREKRPERNLTEWEEERIEKLEQEIKEWEEDNAERQKEGKSIRLTKKKSYRSRAPIILGDEFEKAASESVLNVIGKMTDREMNFSFMDKYFNFRIDLSNAVILLTGNYLGRVPQFILERGLLTNIELLTYAQRKAILTNRFKRELRRFKLEEFQDRITDKFLEMCITETWGIRGGLNNLVATVRFLALLSPKVDNQIDYLTELEDYDEIYETPENDYKKRESGIIRLTYYLNGKKRSLTLTKRIGIEERTIKDEEGQEIKAKEIVTGYDAETGQQFVSDWPEEYWWGTKPVREI